MISRYVILGMGATIFALGAWGLYLDGVIDDKIEEIGKVKSELIISQASAENLKNAINNQNKIIDEFNRKLTSTNARLNGVLADNNNLKRVVDGKLLLVGKKQLKGCEDTMQWMLYEAITPDITK